MALDFSGIIENIGKLNDTIKESFTVLRDFLLDVQLGALSLSFVLLFIVFIIMVFIILASPGFLYNFYMKQKNTLINLFKENKNKRDWIGKS